MADDERLWKPHHPRRNTFPRPPPGVQKAIQNFGVKDLREILDKKHQEQGDSQRDKKLESEEKLPPPDPSYNYLRDPSRDKPKSPPPKRGENKKPQNRYHTNKDLQNHRLRSEQTDITQVEQEKNNNVQSKTPSREYYTVPQNSSRNKEDGVRKKELRFSDSPKVLHDEPQFDRGERSSFRGRNPRRGRGGKPRENRQDKIESPMNIKIQLSTETGQRSCILDENTKIADIKHVPDQNSSYRPPRSSFRGGRGRFRGRGRGRGSFRGRGGISNTRGNPVVEDDIEASKCPEDADREQNNTSKCTDEANQVTQETNEEIETVSTNLEQYDDYEQESYENEEYADSNGNYDDEFSSEYRDDFAEYTRNESERHEPDATNSFDPNLAQTIAISSVEVKATSENVKEKDGREEVNDTQGINC